MRECQDFRSVWQKRVGGAYRASPLLVGDRIYCFSLEGRVPVIAASAKYKLLAENEFPEGFQASPAVVGDKLYLRTTKALYCIAK